MARLRVVAVSFFVLFSASFVFGQSSSPDQKTKIGFGLEIKFFGVSAGLDNDSKVTNVPLKLRQIPSHPQDKWIYGSRRPILTVPSDSIGLGNLGGGLNFSLSPELTLWRFRVRSGVNVSYIGTGGSEKSNEGSTREINQYGKPQRGSGTSLVYYSIYKQNSWKPGLTSEVDFDLGKNTLFIAGYGWNNYKLVTEKGYDRWDALEVYEKNDLSNNRVIKRYIGIGFQPEIEKNFRPISINITAGRMRHEARPTEYGRGLTFKYTDNPWFIEFSFAAHTFLFKK